MVQIGETQPNQRCRTKEGEKSNTWERWWERRHQRIIIQPSLQECLIRVRWTEGIRKRLKKVQEEWAQFIKNPYSFSKSLLGEAKSVMLMSSEEEWEFLQKTFSDPARMRPLEENNILGLADKSTTELSTKQSSWKEIQEVVKHAGVASAAGPTVHLTRYLKSVPEAMETL